LDGHKWESQGTSQVSHVKQTLLYITGTNYARIKYVTHQQPL